MFPVDSPEIIEKLLLGISYEIFHANLIRLKSKSGIRKYEQKTKVHHYHG